ncbi:MAG TPA: MtrB/PioB family outer membrane beta-barrel protein [Rhodospirillaceae bacterium]|nr:MtrB/PioB family outer membrane beta-barrel protein [Rhodospirillaceae bacterium]
MIVRKTLRAVLLTSSCLLPVAAFAAEDAVSLDNQIDVGATYQSKNSFRAGRYTGAVDHGGYSIGDFSILGRDAWDSGNTRYWEATGANLGLESRSFSARYGNLGKWGVSVFYDGIPYYDSESFHTIYDSSGKGAIAGGVPNTALFTSDPNYRVSTTGTTAGLNNAYTLAPDIAGLVNTVGTKTKRDKVGGTFKYQIDEVWSAEGGITHEHKEGTRENALMFGGATHLNTLRYCNPTGTTLTGCSNATSSSTADSLSFAQPVNYDNERYDARLLYTTPRLQGELSYSFMNFTNNNLSFNGVDPFPYVGQIGTLPNGLVQAAYSLPPSSSEHQIRGSVGYNLLPSTRINANVAYEYLMQNDALAPSSNNAAPGYTAAEQAQLAMNPGGLNGKQQNIFAQVGFHSKPIAKLDVKGSFTYDDRDDKTRVNSWNFAARDATSPATATTLLTTANNNPLSFTTATGKLDAGYQLWHGTKFTVGYQYQQKDASSGYYRQSSENAFSAKLKSEITNDLEGALSYKHAMRYASSAWFVNTAEASSNVNSTIPYFQSGRVRDEVKGDMNWEATHALTLGWNGKFTSDHYHLPVNWCTPGGGQTVCPSSLSPATQALYQLAQGTGLSNSHDIIVGPDVNFTPTKDISAHLFYSYQKIFRDTKDVSALWNLASSATTNARNLAFGTSSTPYFQNQLTDETHTVGASGTWQASPKLKFTGTYNFSYGDTTFNVSDGMAQAYFLFSPTLATPNLNYSIVALPDVKSQLHTLTLQGEYAFKPNMSVLFGYQYERFIYSDMAYTIPVTGYDFGNALTPGQVNPSYSVHMVGGSFRVKF